MERPRLPRWGSAVVQLPSRIQITFGGGQADVADVDGSGKEVVKRRGEAR
jgi:hypothetical protein